MTSDIGRDTAGADRTDADRLPRPLERPEQTFSSRAVSVLREMVLSGRMRAGERLNEVELAHALQISRGPLREAIQRLRSEGLLTAVSGRGAFVRTFTIDTLRELYEVRIALETHGVRLAARNSDFHQRIMELADNHALLDVATEVHRQIHLARTRSGHVSTRARQALEEHQEVLKHLADGDGERAAEVLATHLRASLQSVLELLDSEGTMPVDAGEGVNGADSSPVRAARR
jgi:DNA-binding GntR family transcriptional regulator